MPADPIPTGACRMTPAICPTVERIRAELATRAEMGFRKYGTTLHAAPLSRRQVLQHLLEEQLDGAVYTMRLIEMEEAV